jgi:hypothetical protein
MSHLHDRAHQPRIPPTLLLLGAIVVLVPVGIILAWLWLQWQALDLALPWLTMALRILFFTVPPTYVLALVWQRWGRTRYIDAHHITQQTRARVQVAPMAAHYHHEVNAVAGEGALALPAPIDVLKPVDAWVGWVDQQPHCLLAGRTKAGKTHTASAILARRLRANEMVYIVDPHSSGWLGLPTVGFVGMGTDGKLDTAPLHAALMAVAHEYIRRMQARDEHKNATSDELPHNHWPRLTVLIDEANYIADVLPTVWREFVKALASGGRKVGISLLVMGQSPLVEDIQISGSMRANFARLGLDDRSIQQLIGSDEKDHERKKALNAALVGREHPAAATIDAQVWLLDRRGLEAGTAPANARTLVWGGKPSNVSVETTGSPMPETGKETSKTLPSLDADTSMPSILPTAAEIATIAARLGKLPPSKVAETLDGYHPRRYSEFKAKVDYVQALIEGETQ